MELSEVISKLSAFDTPTVCNALELLDNSYRLTGYGRSGMAQRAGADHPVVGIAVTAKVSSISPPTAEQKKLRNDLYSAARECTLPSIICIQDTDSVHTGSFWGEMQASIFCSLGSIGTITEGGVRDLDCCNDINFSFFSTEVLVSHANIHVEAVNCPVIIREQLINPSEIIHVDRHGFAVIPVEKAEFTLKACEFLTEAENIVIDPSIEAIRSNRKPSIEEIKEWNAMLEKKKREFQKTL